jgi:hypothetical protein
MMMRAVFIGAVLSVVEVMQGQPGWLPTGRGPANGYQAEVTYTAPGDLAGDGWRGGELDVLTVRAGLNRRYQIATDWWANVGAGWDGTWFGVPQGAPLPESVTTVALRVGVQWRPAERWSVLLEARPGLFSDLEDVGWQDVNVPVVVGAGYEISTNLVVVLGVGVNFWSRLATMGGPGAMWRFAEDWRLNLILPKPSIDWTPTRGWTVFAAGEIRGGGWRVAEDFGRTHGDPGLDGDTLGYREIRLGGGLRWSMGPILRLTLEGGYAVGRRFEYRDADRSFDVGAAPYVQFNLGGAF